MAESKAVQLAVEIISEHITQKRDFRRYQMELAKIYAQLELAKESIPDFAAAVERARMEV